MPLNNFGFVHNGLKGNLYRSAQPDRLGFEYLKAIGVTHIFKLSNSVEFALLDEITLFKGDVIEKPLPELFRSGCLDQVIDTCRNINSLIIDQYDCHIHCSHGRDRTGLIAGAYQIMYCGKSIKEVDDERPTWGCNSFIEIVDSPDRHILSEIWLLKCAGRL